VFKFLSFASHGRATEGSRFRDCREVFRTKHEQADNVCSPVKPAFPDRHQLFLDACSRVLPARPRSELARYQRQVQGQRPEVNLQGVGRLGLIVEAGPPRLLPRT
jgi:hypothetical protein